MWNKAKEIFYKYKEIILYLIFGGATTVVNWVVYIAAVLGLDMKRMIANTLAWGAAVLFAYLTSKLWVFESKSFRWSVLKREVPGFIGARVFSGVVEIYGTELLVAVGLNQKPFGIDGFWAKLVIAVVVIVMNYIFSKWLIFKKEKVKKNE